MLNWPASDRKSSGLKRVVIDEILELMGRITFIRPDFLIGGTASSTVRLGLLLDTLAS